jgi:limonene-1,2-epoxide hydrolase
MPAKGRESCRHFLTRFGKVMDTKHELLGVMGSDYEIFMEAADNCVRRGESAFVRYILAFEEKDRLITRWRDSHDLTTPEGQLAGAS